MSAIGGFRRIDVRARPFGPPAAWAEAAGPFPGGPAVDDVSRVAGLPFRDRGDLPPRGARFVDRTLAPGGQGDRRPCRRCRPRAAPRQNRGLKRARNRLGARLGRGTVPDERRRHTKMHDSPADEFVGVPVKSRINQALMFCIDVAFAIDQDRQHAVALRLLMELSP